MQKWLLLDSLNRIHEIFLGSKSTLVQLRCGIKRHRQRLVFAGRLLQVRRNRRVEMQRCEHFYWLMGPDHLQSMSRWNTFFLCSKSGQKWLRIPTEYSIFDISHYVCSFRREKNTSWKHPARMDVPWKPMVLIGTAQFTCRKLNPQQAANWLGGVGRDWHVMWPHWLWGCCCLLFVVCCLLFVVVVCCWLLVVCCWLLVVSCLLLVVGCWLLVVVVCCLLFVVCCLLFVVRCSLLVVRCSLFVVCCLLFLLRW